MSAPQTATPGPVLTPRTQTKDLAGQKMDGTACLCRNVSEVTSCLRQHNEIQSDKSLVGKQTLHSFTFSDNLLPGALRLKEKLRRRYEADLKPMNSLLE